MSKTAVKLPDASVVTKSFLASNAFKYARSKREDASHWFVRMEVKKFMDAERIMSNEEMAICDSQFDRKLHDDYVNFLGIVIDDVVKAIDVELSNYRLSQCFDKSFEIDGAVNARRVSGSPVPNTYAVKFDGYYTLCLTDEIHPTKIQDFTQLGYYDSLKELYFSMDYEHARQLEICERAITEDVERGKIRKGDLVVTNRWFISMDDFVAIVRDVMKNVKEKTFSVLKLGESGYISFSVREDSEEVVDKWIYDVVADGLSFDVAKAMASNLQEVKRLEFLEEDIPSRISDAEKLVQKHKDHLAETQEKKGIVQEKIISLIDNNNLPTSVREQVAKYLTPKK